MKKKALIRAYVAGNLGDDLFVQILCKRYPNTQFYIIGESCYREYLSSIPNLTYICGDKLPYKIWNYLFMKLPWNRHRENNRTLFLYNQFASHYPVNVYITGSYFIEGAYWRGLWEEKWYNSRPYIIGCNFGPYISERYYDTYKKAFLKATQVSFREAYSYQLFQELPNVEYHPDIVFTLEVSPKKAKNYYIFTVVDVRKDDNVSEQEDTSRYIEKMQQLAKDIQATDSKVVFLSFCDSQGDMEIMKAIAKGLDSCEILSYSQLKMEGALQLISECKGIVATRFHAMILGFLYEKPVFPICYNQKMENVLKDLEYTGKIQSIAKIHSLQYQHPFDCFARVSGEQLQKLREEAGKHFHLLDQQLQ